MTVITDIEVEAFQRAHLDGTVLHEVSRSAVDGIQGAGSDWPPLVRLHDGDAQSVDVDRRGIAHRDWTTSGVDAIRSGHDISTVSSDA